MHAGKQTDNHLAEIRLVNDENGMFLMVVTDFFFILNTAAAPALC